MQPIPSCLRTSNSSGSAHRLSIEYDGWWMSSRVPICLSVAAASLVRFAE